ncbi:MAG: type III pantothenate kinase [Nitrosomonadales bacterium]|nr:type III pantothenate kinase [Nitrosomonadales bacterium]
MKLLIDAGNTRIKWALVNGGGGWLRSGTLPVGQASELPGLLAGLHDKLQIWVSNVAGEEVANLVRSIGDGQSVQTHFVVARELQGGVRNGYSDAAQLGSDRWAALIAAWRLLQGKCLVVNCGTAITIDALSGRGEFLGGLIMPGVELMQRSLADATDQLKSIHLKPEQKKYAQFPLNTADALFSGAIQAGCGAIQRQHALLGNDALVVLSGGAAEVLREYLNLPLRVVDNLVLQGLLLISQESNT